jgi:tetratricopeptide (TPR) repeat protein
VGRAHLASGDLDGAAEEAGRAVRLQPHGLWPNFLLGLCAYRQGRYVDAAAAFGVCIGAAPDAAECYANRALALEALGRTERALDDYDQALRLDPGLTSAACNRGLLHLRARRYADALDDLRRVLLRNPRQPGGRDRPDRLPSLWRRPGPSHSAPAVGPRSR